MVVRNESYRYVCTYILNWSWVILSSSITIVFIQNTKVIGNASNRDTSDTSIWHTATLMYFGICKSWTHMKWILGNYSWNIYNTCIKTQPLNTFAEKLTLLISKVTIKKNNILTTIVVLRSKRDWKKMVDENETETENVCVMRYYSKYTYAVCGTVVVTACLHTKNTELRFYIVQND